jgi:hypothetical protein
MKALYNKKGLPNDYLDLNVSNPGQPDNTIVFVSYETYKRLLELLDKYPKCQNALDLLYATEEELKRIYK